jgi:hypothetical protein
LNPPGGVIFSAPATLLARTTPPPLLAGLGALLARAQDNPASTSSSGPSPGKLLLADLVGLEASGGSSVASSASISTLALAVEVALLDLQLHPSRSGRNTDYASEEVVRRLLQFLQQPDTSSHSSSALKVFLEAFRICLRDAVLNRNGMGGLRHFVYGASHSPFKKTTALYE